MIASSRLGSRGRPLVGSSAIAASVVGTYGMIHETERVRIVMSRAFSRGCQGSVKRTRRRGPRRFDGWVNTAITKRLLVGRPLSSARMEETLLPKWLALPVFCSDPLSSNAYATEEILLV